MRHDRGLKHLKHLVLFLWHAGERERPFIVQLPLRPAVQLKWTCG